MLGTKRVGPNPCKRRWCDHEDLVEKMLMAFNYLRFDHYLWEHATFNIVGGISSEKALWQFTATLRNIVQLFAIEIMK